MIQNQEITGPAPVAQRIAAILGVQPQQTEAAIRLLDEGATVPFVARYRKEVTGGLDDTQLRGLEERLQYLRDLDERRTTILENIREQGKLTGDLMKELMAADTKTRLEDLYLPFRPKRRTKAQIAREAGLESLAETLLHHPGRDPEKEAAAFVDPEKKVPDSASALEGARYILLERFAEEADLVGKLREYIWRNGFIRAKVVEGKQEEGAKFRDYFDYEEAVNRIPSHRVLALLRGHREDILKLEVLSDRGHLQGEKGPTRCERATAAFFHIRDRGRPADPWLLKTVHLTWQSKILPKLKLEVLSRIRETAEEEAIRVFSKNLHDLLMAPPAGPRTTLGMDPGLRTGVKLAVVDDTGKLVAHETIYPHPPRKAREASLKTLARLCRSFDVLLIAIGNGTGSRETDRLVADLFHEFPELLAEKVMVSEAGASVYSASETAAAEFPNLDVSIRGAVSIARRLQDPLAELVKIDPKSIGVGQYQHDLNQGRLARGLDAVVETCVNAVGVDINTASADLLTRVSGLSPTLAKNIVAWRDENGRFDNRKQIKKVPRMGEKTFEQAAGFLRVMDGDHPLDASAVHPEAYPVAERIARTQSKKITELIGNRDFLRRLRPADYTDSRFGVPTVTDILSELEKPGRDPRGAFQTAHFREGVEELSDLSPGMVLEGVVSNVTNFGAFIDVGVHQDGLVHISQMADHYVNDPREVVKAGEIVKVKILEVDLNRRRISLTMKLG